MTNELLETRTQDDEVRGNLAKWSRRLEERERLLDVREQRIIQEESSLSRNNNLLNL